MYNYGEWTEVRYGRRRGRRPPQNPSRPQPPSGRGRQWGKVRAPPFSKSGGRDYIPPPNRPAPPPRPFQRPRSDRRYLGPQSRSYASVVKQTNWENSANWRRPNTPYPRRDGGWKEQGTQQRYKGSPSPRFGQLIRQIHKIIKVVHHLQNVTQSEDKRPRMIARIVENLTTAIRPAVPTPKTRDLIEGNARYWAQNTMMILEQHYQAQLETLRSELPEFLDDNWQQAFQIASGWARKNLQRIKQDSLDHAEALIAACNQPSGSTQTTRGNNIVPPHDPKQDIPPRTHPHRRIQIEEPVQNIRTPTKDSGTMTDLRSGWSPDPPSPSDSVVLVTQPPQVPAPREQRLPRDQAQTPVGPKKNTTSVPTPSVTTEREELELGLISLLDEEPKIVDHTARFWEAMKMTPIKRTSTITVQAQIHQQDGKGPEFKTPDPKPAKDQETPREKSPFLTATPPVRCFKPTRHLNTKRKLVDWKLTAHKKWVMIGDSNLGRFPEHVIPHLQIESFPGANFRHAQAIISSAISQVVVEKIVLAFGLNCRDQKVQETSFKNLRATFAAAKKKFPVAEIWFPLINFSDQLKHKEQNNLRDLNTQIELNVPFIPLLPQEQFQTGSDNLHWTKLTAEKVLDHWTKYLNMGAP